MASGVSTAIKPLDFRYWYYGLSLSIDRNLWGVQSPYLKPDILVSFRKWRSFDSSTYFAKPSDWFCYKKRPDGSRHLYWKNIANISVSEGGRKIHYALYDEKWHSTFCHHLLPQALSFSLLDRGIDPLHGCIVDVNGSAIAFIGESGTGKSTLAAYFWQKGHPIFSDDLVSPRFSKEKVFVSGGPPHLKLSVNTLQALGISQSRSKEFLHGTSKYVLPILDSKARKRELRLSAIYILSGENSKSIKICDQSACQTFIDLTKNPFNAIQNDKTRWEIQFENAERLIRSVPVRRLSYPRKFSVLDKVYCRIMRNI